MLALDHRGLGGGVLVDELESVLVLTSDELVGLPGESLLVSMKVGIGAGLGSGGSIEVSLLSVHNQSLGDEVVIGLELGIKSGFLLFDGSTVGSLHSWEGSVLVVGGGELGSSSALGGTGGGIGISSSGGSGLRCGLGTLSDLEGLGGGVIVVGLNNIIGLSFLKVTLVIVVGETLVAPGSSADILLLNSDGLGGGEEGGDSDSEFHLF